MTKDEFLKQHGKEAWQKLVELIRISYCIAPEKLDMVNAIVHEECITKFCTLINLSCSPPYPVKNWLEAKKFVTEKFGRKIWSAFSDLACFHFLRDKGVHISPPI